MSDEMLKPMTLRDALRDSPCPRPANSQPEDQNVGDCVDKGLCGCQNGEALRAAASAEYANRSMALGKSTGAIAASYQNALPIKRAAMEAEADRRRAAASADADSDAGMRQWQAETNAMMAASAEPVGYGNSAEIKNAEAGGTLLRVLHVSCDRGGMFDTPLYTHPAPDAAEQCAQLAESHVGAGRSPDYDEACRDIARAIRDTAPGAQADAEIVAALKLARAHIDGCDYDPETIALVEHIDAALAKAKGGSAPVTEVDIDSLTGTADDQGNFANE